MRKKSPTAPIWACRHYHHSHTAPVWPTKNWVDTTSNPSALNKCNDTTSPKTPATNEPVMFLFPCKLQMCYNTSSLDNTKTTQKNLEKDKEMMYVLIELHNNKSLMPKDDDRVCNSKLLRSK